ncbi:protein cereblon [Ditylenchus destructor]|nr:protein cereblon [Ditylenchus destructor]
MYTKFQTSFAVQCDLICRSCGHTITTAEALKNVKSDLALDRYNMSVLGKQTTVQVFKNPVPETFHVITVNGAELKFAGKSYTEDTWFPGFRWTACVCSKCSSHMGWYFESSKDDFVGLVLDYLISADYADTLTKVPLPNRD